MSKPPTVKRKAFAYITHNNRLLVFRHRDWDAGIQVPAGSIDPGETPAQGVLREAFEETGLAGLRIVSFLGERDFDRRAYDGSNEIHHRYFFHLTCDGAVPEAWEHAETSPSEGDADEIWFCLYWVEFPDGVPELTAEMGAMLDQVVRSRCDATRTMNSNP